MNAYRTARRNSRLRLALGCPCRHRTWRCWTMCCRQARLGRQKGCTQRRIPHNVMLEPKACRAQTSSGSRKCRFPRPNVPTLSFPRKRESMARYFRTRYDFGSHEDTNIGSNLFVPSCLCANHFADSSVHGLTLRSLRSPLSRE
jgi:hypothetical protein